MVVETSLNNYNSSNYDYIHYNSLPTWIRVNVASRLAKDAEHWG